MLFSMFSKVNNTALGVTGMNHGQEGQEIVIVFGTSGEGAICWLKEGSYWDGRSFTE